MLADQNMHTIYIRQSRNNAVASEPNFAIEGIESATYPPPDGAALMEDKNLHVSS